MQRSQRSMGLGGVGAIALRLILPLLVFAHSISAFVTGGVGRPGLFSRTLAPVSRQGHPVRSPVAKRFAWRDDGGLKAAVAVPSQEEDEAGKVDGEGLRDTGAARAASPQGSLGDDGSLNPASFDESLLGKCKIVFPEHMPVQPSAPGGATKPLLLYVPGFDGSHMFAEPQFADLTRHFELRALLIPGDDRSTAEDLVGAIGAFLESWHRESLKCRDKPILLGESCGGMLSLAVGIRNPKGLNSIVLVNPATSYRDTAWPTVGRLLALVPDVAPLGSRRLPELLGALKGPLEQRGLLPDRSLGELAFAGTAAPLMGLRMFDERQIRKYGGMALESALGVARDVPRGNAPQRAEDLAKEAVGALEYLFSIMPPATVAHRLKVLEDGSKMIEGNLGKAEVPCLVIAGEDDGVLPSKAESERLKKALPRCATKVVEGGHLLLDGGINVTEIVLKSPLVSPPSTRKNLVEDWTPPSPEEVRNASDSISILRRMTSPVFLSTDANTGVVELGLRKLNAQLPSTGPVLFVGNHQLMAMDLGVLLDGVYAETGTILRGLAHPMLFEAEDGGVPGAMGGGMSGNMYEKFGAVPVSGRNFAKLLQRGDPVLLFPGGLGEALHRKDEYYTLKWPEKTDFVRLAARYNATIVPFGGVGASDAATVLLDPDEVKEFGESPIVKLLGAAWPFARVATEPEDAAAGRSSESSSSDRLAFKDLPIVVPKPPWEVSRTYFMFGSPIRTQGINVKDAEECAGVYTKVQGEVNGILSYLLDNRENDPYKELSARLLYETQNARSAPTFSPPPLAKDQE
uniref:AB hydrolase-1 domain-containing protein n=1 Tax=Hemiselmis tepida TaxID=464990 RepID=A0A7S0VIS5_9CRYP|mmetsp:Transcript_19482/g.49367  ORF Transcript_19482/g.49367 Transcript_19482/m.49367 type:complete len:800 (+) Transcript_19482:252-2651(+)